MDTSRKNVIKEVIVKLEEGKSKEKNAFLGFDACIDIIAKIVKEKNGDSIYGYFSESSQFGEFLLNQNNKSCGIELQTKLSKPGGNMVITANALGKLNVYVECIGTFGFPEILPVFRSISANCTLHTVGETITATALEFDNSKVIMFDPGPYNTLTWEGIKELLGFDKIKHLLSDKQVISFLNWSEIENSSQIWEGILNEIVPNISRNNLARYFFTDFSDCSRKSVSEIQFVLKLLGRFRKHFRVILSLNQNEASLIARAMDLNENLPDEAFIKELFRVSNTDILIIHRTGDAIAYDGNVVERCDTFFCEQPRILTGGGDNFNAGFCYTLFDSFSLHKSLIVANAVSGSYVKNGISPDIDSLMDFLKEGLK